jgi:hypothetical protein
MTILTIEPEHKSRRLNALLGCLCLLAGGGVFLLAVREFRPPSYALLLAGFTGSVALVMIMFKLVFRSVEATESVLGKGVLFLVNGLILGLMLMAVFCLGEYFWRSLS